jgi:hypothetical protein
MRKRDGPYQETLADRPISTLLMITIVMAVIVFSINYFALFAKHL